MAMGALQVIATEIRYNKIKTTKVPTVARQRVLEKLVEVHLVASCAGAGASMGSSLEHKVASIKRLSEEQRTDAIAAAEKDEAVVGPKLVIATSKEAQNIFDKGEATPAEAEAEGAKLAEETRKMGEDIERYTKEGCK